MSALPLRKIFFKEYFVAFRLRAILNYFSLYGDMTVADIPNLNLEKLNEIVDFDLKADQVSNALRVLTILNA